MAKLKAADMSSERAQSIAQRVGEGIDTAAFRIERAQR
jgi:hypothetical protein